MNLWLLIPGLVIVVGLLGWAECAWTKAAWKARKDRSGVLTYIYALTHLLLLFYAGVTLVVIGAG